MTIGELKNFLRNLDPNKKAYINFPENEEVSVKKEVCGVVIKDNDIILVTEDMI